MGTKRKSALMTLDELAKYLKMKRVTIYKHIRQKKLPAGFKVGSSWRFKKATVDSWIDEKENSNNKK